MPTQADTEILVTAALQTLVGKGYESASVMVKFSVQQGKREMKLTTSGKLNTDGTTRVQTVGMTMPAPPAPQVAEAAPTEPPPGAAPHAEPAAAPVLQ